MLKQADSEGASYLDIAQFLLTSGAKTHVASDLEQLFRRIVFNVAVGNRDDHLRNHGFVLTKTGWRLSRAFDINPNIDKADHVLNLDESDNRPSMKSLMSTADLYGLSNSRAQQLVEDVVSVVKNWKAEARNAGIANAEIELMAASFMQFDQPPAPPTP